MSKGKKRAKIGLAIITTPGREAFLDVAIASVNTHLADKLDLFLIVGDDEKRSVAENKNIALKKLMEKCDYIFLMEDDMQILDGRVLAMYIATYRLTGIPHLNFSQHGPNKKAEFVADLGAAEGWPNSCGAFSFYTKAILEEHGLMDENFVNAYEHVEHTWRIYKGKLSYGIYPDIRNSHLFIREQEDANQKPMTPERLEQINKAREYWFAKDPDCPLIQGLM